MDSPHALCAVQKCAPELRAMAETAAIDFSAVPLILAAVEPAKFIRLRPNNSFKPTPLRGVGKAS